MSPFAGYPDFDACVADQKQKGKSDTAARKICGALQARVEKSAEDEEVLTTGPLADALRESAVLDGGEVVISEAFITDENKVVSADDVVRAVMKKSMRGIPSDRVHKEAKNLGTLDVAKMVEGSTQSKAEIGRNDLKLHEAEFVEPPYPPELLSMFLEVDETHYRACKVKATDAVGRPYTLEPSEAPDGGEYDPAKADDKTRKLVAAETKVIRTFIEECNGIIGFEGTLARAAMDNEAVGWAALEVIRNKNMVVTKLAHIPAVRVRTLRGFVGWVELVGPERYIYYQPFGHKVLSNRDATPGHKDYYNPREDGPLDAKKLTWNMVDRETGKPTRNFGRAANEIVWVPRHHANTIYYGMTDALPAMGDLLTKVHIRDYILQYFEHNTVPRYVVVIEGAKLSDSVKKLISEYFHTHVKGRAHKTLVVPIPSMKGEVKVRFEKLDAELETSSYMATRETSRDGILTAHGVSPAILGIAESSELGSGKGLSQAEIYKDRIVEPSQRRWADALNRLFRLGLGVRVVSLKFDPLDIRDRNMEMLTHVGYVEHAIETLNEARRALGLDPYEEGGDRAFMMTSSGPVFVDELTKEASAERQSLEDEIDTLRREQAQSRLNSMRPADASGKLPKTLKTPANPVTQKQTPGKKQGKQQ